MAELSLCMIVRNEEERLGPCLESVKDAVDEIVIVDTGSTDRTKEIARRYTDQVYEWAWEDDFAAARNASLAYATRPFILWLDADDVIETGELEKLIALKEELHDGVDAVMLPYHYAFAPDGRPSLVFERERIVRRAAGFRFEGRVHEAIAVSGNVLHADIAVRHTGAHGESSNRRNLAIYERWRSDGEEMSPRDLYYYARELKSAGETQRAAQMFTEFLTGQGWIENRLDAYVQRGDCFRQLGRAREAKLSYLSSLAEGRPRAEALCALGAVLMEEGDYGAAAFFYRAALLCRMPKEGGAFVSPDAYGYIPLMQLCVCCDRLGEHMEAAQMNERALLLRPGDEAALQNRAYFARILRKTQPEQEKTGREA